MSERFLKTWRKTMNIFACMIGVQVAMYGYLMVKYSVWEMWPGVALIALCGVYFWARSKGWMEPSDHA